MLSKLVLDEGKDTHHRVIIIIVATYPTLHRSLGDCLCEQTHCYTLEVSFFSYSVHQHASRVQVPYNEQSCILTIAIKCAQCTARFSSLGTAQEGRETANLTTLVV